ncbi:hypothetical protein VTN49DRAFT_3682 [Thermomyces lanuginosus]|uniref:uncharacterized protein n=1 Tax=Thermomyces lanuginosus TaxID=5541 RepID=UPI0037425393
MGRKCAKSIHPRKQGRRFVIHPIMIPLPLQCLLSPTNHQPNVFHRQFGSHPRQILAQRTHLISRCKPLFPDRELGGSENKVRGPEWASFTSLFDCRTSRSCISLLLTIQPGFRRVLKERTSP